MNWYTGNTVYDTVLFLGFIFVLLIIIGAKLTQSPYGIFGSRKMGINLHPKAGWILMELPATLFLSFSLSWAHGPVSLSLLFSALSGLYTTRTADLFSLY